MLGINWRSGAGAENAADEAEPHHFDQLVGQYGLTQHARDVAAGDFQVGAGDDDDGDVAGHPARGEFLLHGHAVERPEHQIEHDQIGRAIFDHAQGIEPVGGFVHVEARQGECRPKKPSQVGVILDDQDPLGHSDAHRIPGIRDSLNELNHQNSAVEARPWILACGFLRYDFVVNPPPNVVAIINSTTDIVDMLRIAMEQAGLVVVSALTPEIREGYVDLEQFVKQHEPKVIAYDIAPPYEANWNLFQHVAKMPVMQGRQFVITSTNARHVERLASPQEHIYEVVGKSEDLGRIVQAVKEALRVRPVR